MLDDLKKEVATDPTQFGSTKNCSAEHYLIETWDYILTNLEKESTACNLISIDFSKASNSLDHNRCLEMFALKGASFQSLGMLRSFLESRKMRVKIDKTFSNPLPINGGSPQGTLLGNLIFIVATSNLDKNIPYNNETSTLDTTDEDDDLDASFVGHVRLRSLNPTHIDESPPLVVKYVDDILGAESVFIPAGKSHFTVNKSTCTVYAKRSEELIDSITMQQRT